MANMAPPDDGVRRCAEVDYDGSHCEEFAMLSPYAPWCKKHCSLGNVDRRWPSEREKGEVCAVCCYDTRAPRQQFLRLASLSDQGLQKSSRTLRVETVHDTPMQVR